jgi:hypothetical protein
LLLIVLFIFLMRIPKNIKIQVYIEFFVEFYEILLFMNLKIA